MTTYRYNTSTNCLDEVPTIDEPIRKVYKYWEDYMSDKEKYAEHISSLRHIPVEGTGWDKHKLYVEGDFTVKNVPCKDCDTGCYNWQMHDCRGARGVAILNTEAEEDLWPSIAGDIMKTFGVGRYQVFGLIDAWKNKFTINRNP